MANKLGNRPADTAFKQQRLKSWQPLLTPKNVIPIFFIIGVIFLPIGIALYVSSESVKEIILDYTKCKYGGKPTLPIAAWNYDSQQNICTVNFEIFSEYKKPVFLYYRLTNFYQNHRDYFKSYMPKQLKSDKYYKDDISDCAPLDKSNGKQYYPCGLIANSFFSDEVIGSKLVREDSFEYEFSESGISWSSDKDKYKNMNVNQLTDEELKNLIPPPNWKKDFPQYKNGYTRENFPRLADMERFQVWMRVAGLPNFRKLYGQNKNGSLPKGRYSIQIIDRFDVESFGGTKSIIISNVSAFGGKNPFLGIGYVVVGSLSLLLGIIFLVKNMISPRKLGDTSYLSYKTQ
ncbi:transcription regulator [Piromyces finnis]|uniref:Transcription regulator n=1 Tax=Piromyces finnis TaxID=1754191 RepID=A0A1Y1UY29_9FUNG|nr:transcription regulator [Piromyces finnis]|eukprot:ORX43280.1 transcription regulator [Piromyces finnis]